MVTRQLAFTLGQSLITLRKECAQGIGSVFSYFHPHDSEPTSLEVTRELVQRHGGSLYAIENRGERLLQFELAGQSYTVDPNRIFTPAGITATLKMYGHFSTAALSAVATFSAWLLGQVMASFIIAVHNNRNQGYNIHSYGTAKNPVAYVREIHINPERGAGDFFYTTSWQFFEFARWAGFNAVLQGGDIDDDGSLSVAAALRGIEYVNIEAERGHAGQQREMLDFARRFFKHRVTNAVGASPWPYLKKGDVIDLVDTSSAYKPEHVVAIKTVFASYGLVIRDRYAVEAGNPLGYSNTDAERARLLLSALSAPDSKAVWAVKGGAGASRVLPALMACEPPTVVKPMIGFSDVTDVHLFLNTIWNRSTIHGVEAAYNEETDKITHLVNNNRQSLQAIINMLMGESPGEQVQYDNLQLMNQPTAAFPLQAPLFGGNLTLVSDLMSSPFLPKRKKHILILEDIGSTPHQLERFLDGFRYSDGMQNSVAVILGQFIESVSQPDLNQKLLQQVLRRFADNTSVPVFHWPCFGHNAVNRALPLNTLARIQSCADGYVLQIDVRQNKA